MNHNRFFGFLCLAAAVLLACSLPSVAQQVAEQAAQPPSPTTSIDLPIVVEPTNPPAPQPASPTQAPAPTQALPSPTPDLAACIAGTWEPVDLSPFVTASIPPEVSQQAELTYKGPSGRVTITFTHDGKISLHGEPFKMLFDAKVSFLTLPAEVTLDGTASGSYSLDGTSLRTENMDVSGLSARAQMAGQDLIDPAQVLGSIPLLTPPFNTAGYTCSGDSLQLKLDAYPTLPPLELKRAQ